MSTCASHPTTVSILCGTVIFMYLQPSSRRSTDTDKGHLCSALVLIPMLNSVVYGLRNTEVKGAFRKVTEKATFPTEFQHCGMCSVWAQLLSRAQLFVVPWTAAHQAPLPTEFSRQEDWSGLHFLRQGIFPNQGLNSVSCIGRWILYH